VRIAVVVSHPIQYQAPLFRELAGRAEIRVFFAHRASAEDQAAAGFGIPFEWDVDILSGYPHAFLHNAARNPNLDDFSGCDTPSISGELARGKFDALLLMGWRLKSDWQALFAARRLKIPVMVRGDSHLSTPRSLIKRAAKAAAYPIALRAFDAALYVGEQSRRYWEHYGYPTDRMFFSPHCVDNTWFSARATDGARTALRAAHGVSADAKIALFAGKLLPLKRPLDLISAAAALRRDGLDLSVMIAGSGPLEAQVAEIAALNSVPLIGLGFCNQSMMPSAYAAADLLVLPSSSETWGLVANEALACGKPVIVSDSCGCGPDLAADGAAGAVFPCGDAEGLAAAMRRLLAEPPSQHAISARADRYSPGAAAEGVLQAARASQSAVRGRTLHE
jgi:glycosyltransferase involved in cell wall biosynthesis